MEDGVVQLQETGEDVEGLEEEAVCFTDVLILSVFVTGSRTIGIHLLISNLLDMNV